MSTSNGSKLWGQITSVRADAIPEPRSHGKWNGLLEDIHLRLEKTPRHEALCIPFDDEKEAYRAIAALNKRLRSACDIEVSSRSDGNGGRLVFVRRGLHWTRCSSDEALPAEEE